MTTELEDGLKAIDDRREMAMRTMAQRAAAPDLLRALKEAVRLYEAGYLKAQMPDADPWAPGRWVNAAREAIALAERH